MSDEPLLSVRGLTKHYPIRTGLLRRITDRVRAVDGIDFDVRRGETLGLVGESGCGKSTTARTVLHLEPPTAGTVWFDGERLDAATGAERKRFRRRAQLLFQDAETSFDPRHTVGRSLAEPLEIHGLTDGDRQRAVIADLLGRVGLDPAIVDRYPHEFSGGQIQRLALARAIVFDPDLLIADEPVSGLDERIQAAILSLLEGLQSSRDLAMVYVSHDIETVGRFCDRVAVMYLGEIVERGPVDAVLDDPQHPYTQALVDAVPTSDPRERGTLRTIEGTVPDPARPPTGCRFHPRCPVVISPANLDIDQAVYRGIVRLRMQLSDGEIHMVPPPGVGRGSNATDVGDDRVRADLRHRYGIPSELADETAEVAVSEALSLLVDGDIDLARQRLAETFESVCERRRPTTCPTAVGKAACHRHDDSVAGEPTWSV